MEATAEESRRATKLKRLQNLPDFSVPLYWDNVAPAGELTMVPLQPSSLEFQTLEKNFRKTVNKTVHSIQRIQSPRLRQAYELHLNYTSHKNGQSRGEAERLLYRGASQEFCESVKQTGFNRSYPGVNGTSYGGGMYFAVAANTSSGYAVKDAEGHRRMFVARVVTGRFTGGHRNMKTPPCCFPRQHRLHCDSAVDDVQNPGLFVVFHDNAAYPDHLITFK
ncbi:protein mono-ADP-ribosyltransferase PARP15-like [Lampris incognitus]|uniref:protein mono-ADP-ribosyltransferase PARP15-like n=1 Tax=Lampris incognitus TaxID=2546036 RepID=UPI0024B55227|nr:protein mono-ADP-ribosyltransferase PARP15-like [Lampris incognitus]